jgi:hypothetical protein
MENQNTTDSTAAARRARFGKLPERVHHQDTSEDKPATPNDPTRYACDPEGSWMPFSCIDLAL